MKTLLFAYHEIGCVALQTLYEMGEELCAVFTHEDDLKENVWFGSVKKYAESLNIPCFTPENPNADEWIEKIKKMNPEIIFSFYYRRLLCDEILTIPAKGALNLHGSLLPKFRGRAPVNWVLVKGEKETGITLHYMTKKADSGDIVAQKKFKIEKEDTAFLLYKKMVPLTRELLLTTIPLLSEGKAPRIAQDEKAATLFKGRKPEDGKIDWRNSAGENHNLIRAVTHPYPGAFTFLNSKKIFIWEAQEEKKGPSSKKNKKEGEIIKCDPLLIACGKGVLKVEKIETEGEKELSGLDWTKENNIQIGMILE
ncbi:MAG: formyltransferase [Elusimicrobia bacterium]|nr:formyltransferase [Elusimicrobiota bacterium]